MSLNAEQRRRLKAQAHDLAVVVQTGAKGITPAVIAETETAINHHELIKVRLAGVEREQRTTMAASLASSLGADIVALVGGVLILYRPLKKPKK